MKKTMNRTLIAGLILLLSLLVLAACDNANTNTQYEECSHQYGVWSVTKASTCSDAGIQSRTCQKCGYTDTESIAALGHTTVVDKSVQATCTTPGLTEGKHCSVCDAVLLEQTTIPAAGHTKIIDSEEKAATCTESGWTEGSHCSVCNIILSERKEIKSTGHIEVIDAAQHATCTTPGLTAGKHCSICNYIIIEQNTIPTTEHTIVVDEAVAATCIATGLTEGSHCSVCNYVIAEQTTIPTTEHIVVIDEAVDATCIATGLTEGSHCSVCNYVIAEQTTIPTTEHIVVIDEAVDATCAETGLTEGSHCSICNTVLVNQETVAKLSSHTYVSGVCKHCGKSDPNYVPTYSAGETWTVDGQFEFTIDSVVEHTLCDSYRNENYGFTNMFGIMVNYHYKNIGYSSDLKITYSSISIYDQETEKATVYSSGIWCDHEKSASACIAGTKASASYVYATNNESSTVTVYVTIKDSNGVTQKAQFVVNVTPVEEESEEDKLNGCTINLGTSLPQTISYYTYSGSKQSSCSVTEVSFEVSGDDLYIYFTGRKTYDSRGSGQSDSCKIGWKLYDNNNNVIASGTAYTLSLATGEGFVKTKDTVYNCITAGGTYKLVLLNVN